MTGQQIWEIRAALRLSQPQFAELLGVGHATVGRWEAARSRELRQHRDLHQRRVLAALHAHLPRLGPRQLQRMGDEIVDGLQRGGLYALHAALDHLHGPRVRS